MSCRGCCTGDDLRSQAAVIINVYWHRNVSFDDKGRVVRRFGGNELSWMQKIAKDVLGVYHVGVEVHRDEYTFGNYHAPNARQLGCPTSGVVRHDPQMPGPKYVFKEAVPVGTTTS